MSCPIQNNKKNRNISNIIQSFDFYSCSPSWYINSQTAATTNCGGITAMLVIVLTLLTSYNSIVSFFKAKNGYYEFEQTLQTKPLNVPFKDDFDLIVQIDRTNISNWENMYKGVDFMFYFDSENDLKFEYCETEIYQQFQISMINNILLCVDLKDKFTMELYPKTVFAPEERGKFRNLDKIEQSKAEIPERPEHDGKDNEWYKLCMNITNNNSELCSHKHENKEKNNTEIENSTNPNENNSQSSDNNSTESNENHNNQEDNEIEIDEPITSSSEKEKDNNKNNDQNKHNQTNSTNSTNNVNYTTTLELFNLTSSNIAYDEMFYNNVFLSLINKDNFISPSFYINPKCLANNATCTESNVINYYSLLSSLNEINLLLLSNKSKHQADANSQKPSGNMYEIINMNEGDNIDIYFKQTTVVNDYSIFPFYYKKDKSSFFTFQRNFLPPTQDIVTQSNKIITHQSYNFYLANFSEDILFKREPIDLVFASIVGSFGIYYITFYFICSTWNKYYQEIYLFNKIGRHVFYDESLKTHSRFGTTFRSTNEKEINDTMLNLKNKNEKSEYLYVYSKNFLKMNDNLSNGNDMNNYKLGKPLNVLKISPLKTKNYFGKINRKPTSLSISFINKLKLICGLSHCESSKEGKYIFLMQSFFEMTTYLSAIIDIIKLKEVLLYKSGDKDAKRQDKIVFSNILMSKHTLEEELESMVSPEKAMLTPNEVLPLTCNSKLANYFILN